jgi:hypothetical protein
LPFYLTCFGFQSFPLLALPKAFNGKGFIRPGLMSLFMEKWHIREVITKNRRRRSVLAADCHNNNNGKFTLLWVLWSYLIIFYLPATSHRARCAGCDGFSIKYVCCCHKTVKVGRGFVCAGWAKYYKTVFFLAREINNFGRTGSNMFLTWADPASSLARFESKIVFYRGKTH